MVHTHTRARARTEIHFFIRIAFSVCAKQCMTNQRVFAVHGAGTLEHMRECDHMLEWDRQWRVFSSERQRHTLRFVR